MGNFIDMTGWIMKEHNVPDSRITVLYKNNEVYHPVEWWCKCECGKIFSTRGSALRKGTTKSCGCLAQDHAKIIGKKNAYNLIGQQFGYLTVIKDSGKRYKRQIVWECICKCGNIIEVCTDRLMQSKTSSCGCLKQSLGEQNIKNLLDKNNIQYLYNTQFFKDLLSNTHTPLRFDFIIMQNNQPVRLIEFDGPQHYKPTAMYGGKYEFQQRQNNDRLKNEYAKTHNLPLVRIPYKERDNITLEMLMSDKYLVT